MTRFRFTIRLLFLLTTFAAVCLVWWDQSGQKVSLDDYDQPDYGGGALELYIPPVGDAQVDDWELLRRRVPIDSRQRGDSQRF